MKWRALFLLLGASGIATSALAQLTADDVRQIITQAVTRAVQISPNSVIAVTDREGYVLGVWNVRGGEPTEQEIGAAVAKAGTGAYLSSDQNAFTSRTAGFIIRQHFPPGVRNTPPGPLVGVGFSNLPYSDVNRFKRFFGPIPPLAPGQSPGTLGAPVRFTSLAGSPGGLPLYKNGRLVGGVGVTGDGSEGFRDGPDIDEDVALSGQRGFKPDGEIRASNVFINGIALAYTASSTDFRSTANLRGNAAVDYPIQNPPPPFPYRVAVFGGVQGQVRQEIMSDPLPGTINGQPRLSADEVVNIINAAADRARTTRAGIRLPIGTQMQVFITVVNNPNQEGVGPRVLGTFRTGEATLFSWDVSAQKARTALRFSSNDSAFSTRTVGFLAQLDFPPGIDANPPGPLFGMQDALSPTDTFVPPDPNFPNGITIFPGGFPLYRNGQLIGAIGISGDGVDQDDIVGASGTAPLPAAQSIEADRVIFRDTRLPYGKFPRDPNGTIGSNTPVFDPSSLRPASGKLLNISTRLGVGNGEEVMVGGFIITGKQPKKVMLRAIGPSLAEAGLGGALADPVLEVHDQTGAVIASNHDWKEAQQSEIQASGIAPRHDLESAAVLTLAPGAYTAQVRGENNASGIGLAELYDLDSGSDSSLANISTRGFVGRESKVLIGGFIVGGNSGSAKVMVRAIGPSLTGAGIGNALADPILELRDENGALVAANDDWREAQEGEIQASSIAPASDAEPATIAWLAPGAYTAVVSGKAGLTGIGLVEVYRLP